MPQPDTLYFDDGQGRIRQVPSDKLEIFKQYFPNATQADERALRQIEEERALRSEKEGKTKIPEIKLRQPDLTGLHGSVSLQENASIPEVAKDVLNIHRYDPEISFSAKYGAYKDNPELFRDRWEDTENVPLTELAQKKYDQIKAKSQPKGMDPIVPVGYVGMPAKPQQEKPDELESLKDFLVNTPSGRGFVEYDKKRKESFAQLDKQLDAEIANLEKEIKEKSTERQKLIGRGVPGTRYGVNPSWLSREERSKIEAVKEKDIEEADKIATQDDLDLAMKNLNELKMLQSAVKDKDRNAVSQFFREFGRRLPESLVNIGTMGLADVAEAMDQRQAGPIAQRTEDVLSQYASLHQNDRTIVQDIAQGTTGSLEFMAQFAGAGGIAKGAAGAIGKGLLRQAAKQTAPKGAEKVLKIAGKEVSESLLQTAIMPSTLATAIEKNAENPGSFLDNYANAFVSNLVEVGSERVGKFIPGSGFNKYLPEPIQKIRRATGIEGFKGEFLEEQFATAGHAMLGDEQAEWSDFTNPRKQLITAGVVGTSILPYATINAGGYAAAKFNNAKQKRSINKAYADNLQNMQSVFKNDAEIVQKYVNDIIDQGINDSNSADIIPALMVNIANSEEFDKKQADALIKYSLSYLAKSGLEKGKGEQLQQAQAEAQETVASAVNPATNSIILAKIPGVEEPTFVQGNIVLHEDGSIDTHQSGEIYYTDSNGKRQVIDPKFVDIIENVPAEQAIEEATAAKTAEVVNRQANDEVRPYDKGEIIRFTSDGNISLMGKIQGVDDNGNYQVIVDGVPAPVIVEPRMIIPEDNIRGIENGMQVQYKDQEGNIQTGIVNDAYSLRSQGLIDVDGNMIPTTDIIPIDKTSEIFPENEGTSAEQIEQNVTETAKEETKGQTSLQEDTEQPSGQDVEVEKQAFMQSLPIIREGENKGQIDQSRMTPEQNIKYFEYQYGTDKALRAATKMVDNLKERIKKEQAKLDADPFNIAQNDLVENLLAQQKIYQDYTSNAAPVREDVQVAKSAPDEKTNIEPVEESVTTKAPVDVPEQTTRPNKKRTTTVSRQDEQQEQAKRDENMSDVDRFLSDVEAQKEAIRQEVEKMTPKQREEWWGEPQSLREYIMRELINGQRILWSDTPTSKGFGSHLGMKGKEKERRKYIGLLGSAKTNALTPEAFAHKVWEDVVSKGGENEIGVRFQNVDTMGVLDEVLDVLYTHYSKGQMISDINESRLEQVFNELDMQAGVAMSGAWDIDPNERSQNEILLELRSEAKDDEISTYEIEEYYVNQVTQDEFYEYFYKFVANNNDYDETGEVGNNQQDAGEGSVLADGEGRDTGSSVDNEGAERADRADEGEAETPEESAGPIGYGQNDQGGRGQNAEGVAGIMQEGTAKSLEQRIKEDDAELKKKQFAIIQASNPMKDDIHTGIRSADEILTAEEAFSPLIESGDRVSPDFTAADMAEALKSGQITVYSSYPITNGVFVTPSRMMAEDYAGGKDVYSVRVPINSVAWIDESEGQLADVDEQITTNDLVVNERGATLSKNKPNEKRKQKAINLQINWDEENGNVSAKRDEAFGADPETRDIQRKADYDPAIDNRVTSMERLLINRGHLDFVGNPLTGPVKITDANDVAFLFKNLERAQSENVFIVLAKDNGEYRVLYLTTGSSSSSIVDTKLIAPAAKDFGATKMWMVHNHPSGKLEPSVQDISVHRNLEQLGEVLDISVMPSIIINLDSGKYAKFSEWSRTTIDMPSSPAQGEAVRVDVYSFDRQMLYTPFSEKQKIKSSMDVALFLSQQKRGTVDKIHALIIDRANNVNRYILIDGNVSTDELNKILLEEVGRHGEHVILSTNGIQLDFKSIKKALNIVGADLLDVLTVKQDDDIINSYESLNELGLLADEQAGYEPRQPEDVPGTTYNGLMFHVVDEAGYYSTVEDALEKIKQEKGTPEQFKAMLLKNGAKQAELDWMGWDETFTGKSVTKAEIQDWINQNKIEISEVRKEKPEPLTKEELEFKKQDIEILADLETREKFNINEPINLFDGYYYQGSADEDVLNEIASKNGYSDYEEMFNEMNSYYKYLVDEEYSKLEKEREDNTKYSNYILPGGRNYKELLLTMPRKRYRTDETKEPYQSQHFDEPNIVAHIRFDERMANGERVLFLQEIQSDWAQQGKRHGFKTGKDKDVLRAEKALEESNKNLEKAINRRHELGLPVGAGSTEQKMFGSEIWLLGNNKEYIQLNRELEKVRNNKDYNSIQQRMEEIKKEYNKANSDYQKALDDVELDSKVLEKMKELSKISERHKVPDMPFKKTDQWVTLAFRKMMRYAAENGYDRIAWTTGEQQADRYNLSKQVDRIVIDEENGQYSIMAVPKGGQELENIATATKENLSDYVGKEIASKAINEGGGDFRGDDLKVGGTGMRSFYDQIVPSVVKKIGKPFGVDIETIELPETGAQQSIPITDDMRGYAEQGMPLFSIAQMSEDVDARLNAAKTPQEKTKIVSDMVDELENRYRKSVDTVVLPTKKDVFESLRMMGADSELLSMAEKTKAKLNGVFFNGVIYLNSSSLDKAKNVAEVWAHENFHAWISDKKELLVPLINNLDDNFLNANLHAYYHGLNKEEKVNELLAFAVGRIFTGRDIARIKEADVILPVIIKYLDYVTEGEFSKSGARIRSGRRSDADALRDNQRGLPQGERINQPGEVSHQPQQEDGTVLSGYGGISGAGRVAESAYAPMPQQKEGQSLEDYSREVSDWYFKQRELSTPPLFSVSDAADRAGSKMPEDLRKEYDIKYDRFFTRFREAWEDTFLPVKDFLDLLRKNGVEIAEYNDFYKQATHLQGKNDAQLKIFKDSYQHPITLAVSALVNKGFRYRDIENYVFAKHGLERNEYMRNAAIAEWENNHPEAEEDERAAFIKSLPNDYAGITALEEELGQPAEMFIDSFENKAGEEDIDRLWTAINNATHWTLTKQYQAGMINKEVYDDLMNRYQYYVPLRGHDKETAEDRWDYTPDMGTFFTAPLARAKGRRSRAESPFAFIEQMAHSAIVQGNKNTLKQSILRLAQKENGGLMSATKTWKVNVGTKEKPIWEQQSAPYSEDLDTYLQNQQLFEERMQQLKKEGMAYQGRAKLDIGDLFIKPKQAEQHEIRVYQNGISYTVYINANPAIAKAINGANRKDISNNLGLFSTITRNMAANFTTRNPLFVMTNFSRDYIYSTTMLLAKETPEFMLGFQRNLPAAANALRRYERGNVDLNKKSDQYLYEYMINGGKTGFSHIFELDRVAKSLEREAQKGGKKNFADHARAIIDVIDMFNEVAENTTRLSVYITSREHGKSIIDSINDAKNITVNFNQKGAGSSVGKNSFEQVILSAAGWVRPLYLFSNAAIQALSNIVKVTNKHPVKMASILSSYALIGFISPMLAAMIGGDDGEDDYMKLSDWERQSNWCVLLPNGSFLKIPLPQELRIFSRIGDNIYQAYTGKKDILQVLMDIAFSISDLLPMNPLGAAGTSWAELSPDFARPIVQIVGTNTNFMGSRIYNEWANKNMPGYLKARTNKKGEYYAPNFMVDWFMILDHLTGGDGVKKGVISLNPDITNHLLRGYFGGLYTIAEQGVGIASEVYNFTKTGELDIKIRETPLRAFYADKNDLQLQSSGISSRYYDIYDKVTESRRRAKGYTEKVQKGEMGIDEYSRVMSELNMPKINAIYDRIKEIKRIEREMKEMNPQQQKQAEEMIFDLRKEVVELNSNQ